MYLKRWGTSVKQTELYYEEINSPVGTLLIVGQNDCVLRIDFGGITKNKDKLLKWSNKFYDNTVFIEKPGNYSLVKRELEEYFLHKREVFSFNFKLLGTPFQEKVWKTLYQITPYGNTKTYQELAIAIKNPNAIRAIGGAMNKNPISIVVPCHRIIGKSGKLVGYGGGLSTKKFLLELESQKSYS